MTENNGSSGGSILMPTIEDVIDKDPQAFLETLFARIDSQVRLYNDVAFEHDAKMILAQFMEKEEFVLLMEEVMAEGEEEVDVEDEDNNE